jgi:glycosyltransferase involved in cell wall biosynthesis
MDMLDKPMGGTELMYEELMKHLPQEYKDKFSIFTYPANADTTKHAIYWNHLSYDQPSVQFLSEPSNVDKIDNFVFISHWQSEQFRKMYNVPGYKTQVMKNACLNVEQRKAGPREKVKLYYASTPWRGLDVLLHAWELANTTDCELHVFSSTKIYGKDFAINNENYYQELYDKCEALEGVVYRGFVSNEELRKELSSFDILAYPCTFEETSCITVIEALSAGLRVVTSNLGALPETTEGWARMYPYLANPKLHALYFVDILEEEINKIKSGELDAHLELQKQVYAPRWSWSQRINEWISYLNTLTPKKQSTLEPISEILQDNLPTETQTVGL